MLLCARQTAARVACEFGVKGACPTCRRATRSVANSGPVIPPGEVGRLLQPFQRLATSRSSDGDGHGLGLPIVGAVATAHGATLATRARAEGGLQVQVCFPAVGAAAARQEAHAAAASARLPAAAGPWRG